MVFTFGVWAAERVQESPRLRDSGDFRLQAILDHGLDQLRLTRAVRDKRLAVAVVDLTRRDRPRVAQVNGDEMMYAASLPKIGILLGAFVEIERGRLRYTRALRKSLTDMIRVSSNVEATRVMNLVGKHQVSEILASERFRLYDPEVNGGLWVGKEYGKRPAFQRDPLHNISHGATAMQVARFYYLLETGQLLNPRLSALMKDALSRPAINHKFVKGLRGRDVTLFRKSGSWERWHADSAIVESPRGTYILVALAEDPAGGEWMARIARTLHDAIIPQQMARN
jgi:beta-lactamase class A